ncbi:MAG: hypothetical protein H7836_12480 [Magnetococcus sp. YQC-3]
MPTPLIKSLAVRADKPVNTVEKHWKEAKQIASKEGHKKDWPYIVGITKKMSGLSKNENNILNNINNLIQEIVYLTPEKKLIKYKSIAKRNKLKRIALGH